MTRLSVPRLLLVLLGSLLPLSVWSADVVQKDIPEPFISILRQDPSLVATDSAVIQKMDDQQWIVVATGSCKVLDSTPEDLLRCLRVSLVRAQRALTKALDGYTIDSKTEVASELSTTSSGIIESAQTEIQVTVRIRELVNGSFGGVPTLSSWISGDGLFHIVLGAVVDVD